MNRQVCGTPSRSPSPGYRDAVLAHAQSQLGCPYIWPDQANRWALGKGQKLPDGRRTFDCSGLVSVCLTEVLPGFSVKGQRVVPAYWNAHRYYSNTELAAGPDEGPDVLVLAFWGSPERCIHVELVFPDGRSIGAVGGNSRTVSVDIAEARGARVRTRPHYTAGRTKDFLALHRLPLAPSP